MKCTVCEENEAIFCIKGSSECYCEGCAIEFFGDINYLQRIEEKAKVLKEVIKERMLEEE